MLVIAVLMIPVGYSYGRAITGPGNDSLGARSVEWMRENHMGWAVDKVERTWYDHHQAPIGGQPSADARSLGIETQDSPGPTTSSAVPATTLPAIGPEGPPIGNAIGAPATISPSTIAPATIAPATTAARGLDPPAPLVSPASQPVAGEGQWLGIGPQTPGIGPQTPGQPDAGLPDAGRWAAYGTLIRPDAVHTSVLDAVVWMDPTLLEFRQYPGVKIPGSPWDRTDYVEPARQPALLAAFEGGFRLNDSHGGMFLGTTMLKPLRDGGATFVVDHDGRPDIGKWGRDFTSTATLDSARQNLDLIVDGGAVVPTLATDPNKQWGFTGPANKDAVWRSGAGITADGALVWVGGNGLSVVSLAQRLVSAGAVRAMQLDINHEWVQFNVYTTNATGEVHGSKLLSDMQHGDDRYLSEDTRDFIAVFRR
ncbi:MAG: hypothetical protein ABIQ39_14435 [Ilumatobacteraceae bacterium]